MGKIEALGEGVKSLTVGQCVVINPLISCGNCEKCKIGQENLCTSLKLIDAHIPGAFAEWVKVPEQSCFVVDGDLSATEGTLVEPFACGLRACKLGAIEFPDTVAIFGAGIIGLTALEIAKSKGVKEITVIDTNSKRLAIAQRWGAATTINALTDDVTSLSKCYLNEFDIVIDAVGHEITRNQSIRLVRPGGRVVFIGLHTDSTTLPGNVIVRSEINIVGSFPYTAADFRDALKYVKESFLLNKGIKWFDERKLERGDEAFQELIEGSDYSKIVLKP